MEHLSGQSLQHGTIQPASVWYNYSTYSDLLSNNPLQLQVAVPTVQVIQSPSVSMTPTPTPTALPLDISFNLAASKSKTSKKRATNNEDCSFCCVHCNSSFTSASNLRSHMRIHSGVRPFECDECGKTFIQSSNLKAHKRVHTGERPYQCSECNQTFSRSSHLVGHKRTHTGERPYICGICSEAFFTSSHLRNHVQRHTGEKPYICQYCGDSFGQSVELRIHTRYHTGERPFKCRECDGVYISATELKVHRKALHLGSRPFVCELCNRTFRTSSFASKHKVNCAGPKAKRPKGRPRKLPHIAVENTPWKKSKKIKNKKEPAPSDRVMRPRTKKFGRHVIDELETIKGSINSQLNYALKQKNQIHNIKHEMDIENQICLQEQDHQNQENVPQKTLEGPLASVSKIDYDHQCINYFDIEQKPFYFKPEDPKNCIPVVHVVLDENGTLQEANFEHNPTQSLMAQQIGVIDLSGQPIQDDPLAYRTVIESSHPLITGQDQILPSHKMLSDQQTNISQHIITAGNISSRPQQEITSHQHLLLSHPQHPHSQKNVSSHVTPQPHIVMAHQHQIVAGSQSISLVAAHIPAHQQLLSGHSGNLVMSGNSHMIYDGCQPFVVDLSNPSTTTQVVNSSSIDHYAL